MPSNYTLNSPSLPLAKVIHVDTRGAVILSEESPEVRICSRSGGAQLTRLEQTRDSRGIYLPNHIEPVSHIAVDVSRLFPWFPQRNSSPSFSHRLAVLLPRSCTLHAHRTRRRRPQQLPPTGPARPAPYQRHAPSPRPMIPPLPRPAPPMSSSAAP